MSVILLILKIIGIVLLSLLGLFLFLLALALFVPVRYTLSGRIGDETSVRVRITWLLHLVSFKAAYADGGFDSCLRILGIRMRGKKVRDASEEEPDGEPEDNTKPEEDCAGEPKITARETAAPQAKSLRAGSGKDKERNRESVTESQRKPGIIQRIQSFFSGVRSGFRRFKEALSGIKDRTSVIKSILLDENNKIVFAGVLSELRYLFSHFKFRKIDTDLRFSLGDPAATGQALGALSIMPFLYRYQCRVYPDFEAEEVYVRGTFAVKGRARAVHGAVSLLRLIWKKEVRALIKKLIGNQ